MITKEKIAELRKLLSQNEVFISNPLPYKDPIPAIDYRYEHGTSDHPPKRFFEVGTLNA